MDLRWWSGHLLGSVGDTDKLMTKFTANEATGAQSPVLAPVSLRRPVMVLMCWAQLSSALVTCFFVLGSFKNTHETQKSFFIGFFLFRNLSVILNVALVLFGEIQICEMSRERGSLPQRQYCWLTTPNEARLLTKEKLRLSQA